MEVSSRSKNESSFIKSLSFLSQHQVPYMAEMPFIRNRLQRLSSLLAILTLCSAQSVAGVHLGLLTDPEMDIVLKNARATQRLLLPELDVSACWPFDSGANGVLFGTAGCTVVKPNSQNGKVEFQRGPDLS